MPTLSLPLGSGLDRASGAMAVRPGSLRDARNVYLRAGKAEVRRGMLYTATLPDQGGHLCSFIPLLSPMRVEGVAIAAGYYAGSREVHLYRLPASGEDPAVHLGLLFSLHADAAAPPRLHAAEVGGRLFIAHDEPLQSRRAPTMVYDPLGSSVLYGLTATFNAAGEAPVRFRGVLAWSEYLVGWGFASATENRPEIVRTSLPGRPLEWDANHYFIAGTRGDPVVSCRPAGGNLLAIKASQTYRIHGSSHLDFGILPLHALTGTLSHSLTIELDGRCFVWSAEGPAMLTGQADPGRLEQPLDLKGPQPTDFIDLDYSSGFVQYIIGRTALEWVFGTVSFVFAGGEWSYGQSASVRDTGALIFDSGSLIDALDEAPTGFPSSVSADAGATEARIGWTNTGALENETAEVWVKPAGGNWTLAAQIAVAGATQEAVVGSLSVAVDYDAAVRYRRGGRYTAGYEDDPSSWPATSRTTFTTELNAPDLTSVTWSRTSASTERARVVFAPDDPAAKHQILRDGSVIATLEAGVTTYDDTGITGEAYHTHTVRAVLGAFESVQSNALTRWMGPEPGPSAASAVDSGLQCGGPDLHDHGVSWTNGNAAWETEIRVDGASTMIAAAGVTDVVTGICANPADPRISVRHRVTAFGVHDYSPEAFA